MPTATYWRFTVTNSTYTVLAISEIKFFDGTSTQIPTTGGTASTDDATNGAAANAFDGNAATFWATGSPATPSAPHWIQYQFTSAVTPVTYSLTNRSTNFQNPDSWTLQSSNDGSTWTTVGNYSAAWTSAGQTLTFNVAGNGLGTAYRLLITAVDGGTVAAMVELVFKDSGGTAIPLSNGASFASTVNNGDFNDGSADAFDGNTGTFWASNGNPATAAEWLGYRFASTASVGSFSITARSGAQNQTPANFSLQKSTDGGATWTTLQTYTSTGWAGSETRTFGYTPTYPQRGNIDYDQIRKTARTGDGTQLTTWNTVPPATHAATGSAGQIAYDSAGNFYWCYAANSWARIGSGGYSNTF